uniref:zinc finger protein 438 n=1 Tax=Jaculus jaculus TaxID=51337 RepID=UPI001E1B2401|nr:zinc finger protein 438 [Jaculus jaculus]XP_045006506.1 zinc finger protein 438 [Jaculus jaculus]XP_045006507.1 zinc finger protein 438 [Jaculus jaculus]XP_045006508.1 zinc finger protein 438 [Jaculus jaculus]XP_045006509.1 zinc finger protein 438 [Jaculus jaculus]XP_045006510.1 zinc finger protein 438 [Jaculus jaculus]XP_045006511.1 zinc finger protein 438 [Jaculus jaculus]XP_045006512.1 zinc finger protein 438 [Jaculus jaculus]
MQSSSVLPQDQMKKDHTTEDGGGSQSSSAGEKPLAPHTSESPEKTACTGESNIPSGTKQSGKSLQNKSQFRSIAPKIVPKVLTSRILPCPSPSMSDQGNLAPSLASKSLGMPTQNYALMQVAGQEGTFSLVALPNVASAQPVQKPRMSLPENLKLPIPRYKPPRSNKGLRKKRGMSASEASCHNPPDEVQTCCQMSPPSQAHHELPRKSSPFKQMVSLDQAPVSIGSAPLTSIHGDIDPPDTLASGIPEEPSAAQHPSKIPQKASWASTEVPAKPAVATEEHTEQGGSAQATAGLSPATLSSAVQLVSLAPMSKLAILPCSRLKTTEVVKVEPDADVADCSSSGRGADHGKSCLTGVSTATKAASKIPAPRGSKSSRESAFCPGTRVDLSHKAKLSGGPAKRRGRKRKVPDEVLAFQGKRRKCIMNMCKDGKERSKNNPQESRDQKPGALRKYRSIMPKPVIVMSALAPLVSPATAVQSQMPSNLGQGAVLHNSLASKYLGCRQNDSPAPKPGSAYRNGFSGIKKPWYKCHVCNYPFQFKQHLLDHMNAHTNRRPYSCRICHKAYVHPGSLSTHMKLHHGENRPKKLVCCEFCAKVFGHIRVYFGHLREVHRVVISTEPSPSEPKNRDAAAQGPDGSLERESKSSLEEDFLLNHVEEVKLQIRCGRCQITAQSFAEIKFHLLHVHGEEVQGRLREVILPDSRASTPDQKQRPGKRKQPKPWGSAEDSRALPKPKRQLSAQHQTQVETLPENEGGQPGVNGPPGSAHPSPHTGLLWSHSGFNCLLCAQTLGRKEDLLLHWRQWHNCEDPSKLWAILSAPPSQVALPLPSEASK